MSTATPIEERHVRPFGEWLATEAHGALHDDLSTQLNDLIRAVCDTAKKGTLSLTITVAPATKTAMGDVAMVTVSPKVELKAPRPTAAETIYFIDADRNLARDNPAQAKLPLREVPAPIPLRPEPADLLGGDQP